jgi:hypothetical protein
MLFREYLRAPHPVYNRVFRLIKSAVPTLRSFGICRGSRDQGFESRPMGACCMSWCYLEFWFRQGSLASMSLSAASGSKRGASSGDIGTSRPTRKQKAGKAKAKADTAAKGRGGDVGKSPPMPA